MSPEFCPAAKFKDRSYAFGSTAFLGLEACWFKGSGMDARACRFFSNLSMHVEPSQLSKLWYCLWASIHEKIVQHRMFTGWNLVFTGLVYVHATVLCALAMTMQPVMCSNRPFQQLSHIPHSMHNNTNRILDASMGPRIISHVSVLTSYDLQAEPYLYLRPTPTNLS